jgi:hypothetical protein
LVHGLGRVGRIGRVVGRGNLLGRAVGIGAGTAGCMFVARYWPGMVGCVSVHPFLE